MKLRILIAFVLIAGAWLAGRHYFQSRFGTLVSSASGTSAGAEAGPVEQKVDESYRLNPGALVEVRGINGPVEIATADGDSAEVHVVNNMSDGRFAEGQQVKVEYSADRLAVYAPSRKSFGGLGWLFGGGGSSKQQVTLRLPRRVQLRASGINGQLRVGELDGSLKVSGVSGAVEVARATQRAEVSGVNGRVTVGLAALGGEGTRVSGVNGPVELRFAPDVNADIRAGGINGPIDATGLSNAQIEDEGRSKFAARVGAGGATIKLGGINGPVTLKSSPAKSN